MNTLSNIQGRKARLLDLSDEVYIEIGLKHNEPDEIVVSSEYYGDRTENWFVCYRNGVEISRHNAAHIRSVYWLQQVEKGSTNESSL